MNQAAKTDQKTWAGLDISRYKIMGVLNVTPDSFSDGGRFATRDRALQQGERLIKDGADILDIGGESTRPGSAPVSPAQEQDRILPLIEAGFPVPISVDTRHPETIRLAYEQGQVKIWNDVTALSGHRDSRQTALDLDVCLCLMHMQGQPQTMQSNPTYGDVVAEVRESLLSLAHALVAAGKPAQALCLDVGIGFGKTLDHNLTLLNNLDQFVDLPFAHLVGLSRKSYISKAMERAGHGSIPVDQRLPGSLSSLILAYQKGCRLFRVHDVAHTRQALEIAEQTLNAP